MDAFRASRAAVFASALVGCVAIARADDPPRIQVTPWCARTEAKLGFHVAFKDGARRTVVNLTCDVKSGGCSGATLELAGLDRGEPLGAHGLNAIVGARLMRLGAGADVSRIEWGARMIAVNHAGGFVSFDGVRGECR